MNATQFARRLCQIAVVSLFCLLPWLNFKGFNDVSGSLFSFEFFGIPFADPAAALQAVAVSASLGMAPAAMACIGALIALLIAFCLGRVFCGWLCPWGFFSELVFGFRSRWPVRHALNASPGTAFLGRCAALAAGILALVLLGYPLLGLISFPGELSLLPMGLWQGAGIGLLAATFGLPLIILIFEAVCGQRLWCRFACPQSVLLGLAAWALPRKVFGLRIGWNPKKCVCGKLSPCREACSLNINPRKKNGTERRDCQMCGECVKTCAKYGNALQWRAR